MNEEMKDKSEQEKADDSNFNGHPHGMKDPESLKKVIAEFDKAIAYHEKKKGIVLKQYELIAKYPRPMNPTFEYETKDEWIELLKTQNEMNIEPKMQSIDEDIRTTKDRQRVYKEMLEVDLSEADAKEELKEMIKKRAEDKLGGKVNG